jgi:lipopolysaccharide export system permease protein
VSVSLLDPQRHESTRIVASEAWLDPAQGWVFRNGRELTFQPETRELIASRPFAERVEPTFREDPKLMLLIDRRPKDLSLPQLQRLIDYFALASNPKATPYEVRYFSLMADTFAPLIVIAIAIPFAVTGVRVNPAVGVSKSIGLFFLYYILSNVGSSLATKEILSPLAAAWVPNVGMMAIAAWFFARLR